MIFGINLWMAGGMLFIWAVGFAMGLLTSSMVRDILKEKLEIK